MYKRCLFSTGGTTLVKQLIHASHTGSLALVQALCQGDMSNLNHQDSDGFPALMNAMKGGHLGVVPELLKHCLLLHLKDSAQQQDALFHVLSTAVGDPGSGPDSDPRWEIATALLKAGAPTALEPSNDQSPPLLHRFCRMGNPSAVKWMLKFRANFDINARRTGPVCWTPLMECTVPPDTEGTAMTVQLLFDAGADPTLSLMDRNGHTGASALIEACDHKYISQVRVLIEADAVVNYQKANSFSPLHMAAVLARFEVIQLLLDNGAYVTTRDDRDYNNTLHRACTVFKGRESEAPGDTFIVGATACVKLLIDKEARTEVHHWAGWTPLLEACSHDHLNVMRALLKGWIGCQLTKYSKNERERLDALMYAATAVRNRMESCRMLVEEGNADTTLKNAKGQIAIELARNEETCKHL